MIIYGLIDPRTGELRYIGQTVVPMNRRLGRHLQPSNLARSNTHSARWLRGLKSMGLTPEIRVLETCNSIEELNTAEQFFIAFFRCVGANLTNLSTGGRNGRYPHSEESKAKIRKALTGKPKSKEHAAKVGMASRGRVASLETRKKLMLFQSQRIRCPLPQSTRIAIRDAKGGSKIKDQTGRVYESINDAARKLSIDLSHVCKVVNGKRSHVKGFRFERVRVQEWPASAPR